MCPKSGCSCSHRFPVGAAFGASLMPRGWEPIPTPSVVWNPAIQYVANLGPGLVTPRLFLHLCTVALHLLGCTTRAFVPHRSLQADCGLSSFPGTCHRVLVTILVQRPVLCFFDATPCWPPKLLPLGPLPGSACLPSITHPQPPLHCISLRLPP